MSDLLPILAIIGLAGSKYIVALALIFAGDFNFWQSISLAIFGGMLGVIVFSYFGDALKNAWQRIFPNKNQPDKIRMTKMKRAIVRVRKSYGLAGIAFLTPIILTVPVGAMLASTFYKNKLQVFAYMFAAFTFWSVLLCGTYQLLGAEFTFGGLFH